jgi:prepilin-type N-terminal cleavage/methylation domain-containing protein
MFEGIKNKKSNNPRLKKSGEGFTLIEILVVIAIIGLLASVIITSITKARYRSRDTKRVSDLKQIQKALEIYISNHGSLPSPSAYGRSNVSPGWWDGWWDLSTNSAGNGFMNFLVTDGIMSKVPVDPTNSPSGYNGALGNGYQYFYYVAPKSYIYQGGSCVATSSDVYLIGATQLESDSARPPTQIKGSECNCLWQNLPNMFQSSYSYIICGY